MTISRNCVWIDGSLCWIWKHDNSHGW